MNFLSKGTIIDSRYEVLSAQGQGGMGQVYKARDIELEREIAIKLLHEFAIEDQDNLNRFELEAKVLSALEHHNILKVYRIGCWQDRPYIAMEQLDGQSLRNRLDKVNRLSVEDAIHIVVQCADALAHAHAAGIVHRDISPANIMLLDKPEANSVKIIDFGLARLLPESELKTQSHTRTGFLIGSVNYMSPEQCQGKTPDHRSDIYALGAVLYEMLSGELPFQADNPIAVMHLHVNEKARSLSKVLKKNELPDGLEAIVDKSMQKLPEARFQSMDDFADALRSLDLSSSRASRFQINLPVICISIAALLIPFIFQTWLGRHSQPPHQTISPQAISRILPRGLKAQLSKMEALPAGDERFKMALQILASLQNPKAKELEPQQIQELLDILISEYSFRSCNQEMLDSTYKILEILKARDAGAETMSKAYANLGKSLESTNHSNEAEKAYEKALVLARQSGRVATINMSRCYLAKYHTEHHEFTKAREELTELYEYFKDKNSTVAAECLARLGLVNIEDQKSELEKDCYQKLVHIRNDKFSNTEKLMALSNYSQIIRQDKIMLVRCHDWEDLLNKAEYQQRINFLIMKAGLQANNQMNKEAVETYKIALQQINPKADPRTLIRFLPGAFSAAQAAENISFTREILAKMETLKANCSIYELAELFSMRIQQDIAENNLEKALADLNCLEQHFDRYGKAELAGSLANATVKLAQLIIDRNENYSEAAGLADKCRLLIGSRIGKGSEYQRILQYECHCIERAEDYRKAIPLFQEAIAYLKKNTHSVFLRRGDLYSQYGRMLFCSKNISEIEKFPRELKQSMPIKTKEDELSLYLNTADFCSGARENKKAEEYYLKAEKLAERISPLLRLTAGLARAQMHLKRCQPEKVLQTLKGLETYKEKLSKGKEQDLNAIIYFDQLKENALITSGQEKDYEKTVKELLMLLKERSPNPKLLPFYLHAASFAEKKSQAEKAEYFLKKAESEAKKADPEERVALKFQRIKLDYLTKKISSQAALSKFQEILPEFRNLKRKLADQVDCILAIADILAKTGKEREAGNLLESALKEFTEDPGKDHPYTLQISKALKSLQTQPVAKQP
ncbi:MAG: serine/threonine protein kinase [Candidatus Obscuribacterales bacterium]|nr:serine/threonine protein kinase [Candidatus Obscuribacterales bacterium]